MGSDQSPDGYDNSGDNQIISGVEEDVEEKDGGDNRSILRPRTGQDQGTERAARSVGISKDSYTVMHLDLASLDSVRQLVNNFPRTEMPLDVLVSNAAIYLPTAKEPSYTAEGFELSVGTNHLGHFLLAHLLLDVINKSDNPSKRLIIVGSVTGTTKLISCIDIRY